MDIQPEKIYKFISLDDDSFAYFLDILQFNRLYIPLNSEINDPCEGIFKYSDDTQNPYKTWAEQLDNIRIKNEFRILSLSESHTINSMWAYYAGNHSGVCLEFDRSKLFWSIIYNTIGIYSNWISVKKLSIRNPKQYFFYECWDKCMLGSLKKGAQSQKYYRCIDRIAYTFD